MARTLAGIGLAVGLALGRADTGSAQQEPPPPVPEGPKVRAVLSGGCVSYAGDPLIEEARRLEREFKFVGLADAVVFQWRSTLVPEIDVCAFQRFTAFEGEETSRPWRILRTAKFTRVILGEVKDSEEPTQGDECRSYDRDSFDEAFNELGDPKGEPAWVAELRRRMAETADWERVVRIGICRERELAGAEEDWESLDPWKKAERMGYRWTEDIPQLVEEMEIFGSEGGVFGDAVVVSFRIRF